MTIERRLERLEAERQAADGKWEIPHEVLVLLKAVARHRARAEGREPPPYTQQEIEEMHRQDVETAAGRGVEAELREGSGWRDPEAKAILAEWEEQARERLEKTEGLAPEDWHFVYEDDDIEEASGD